MRDQAFDELTPEFGVRLDGEHPVVIKEGGVLAEIGGGEDLRPLGLDRHLILVPGVQGVAAVGEVILCRTDGPAAPVFLDLAAHRLRDDLVAEAHAHDRDVRGIGFADEILQRRNPGVALIGAEA